MANAGIFPCTSCFDQSRSQFLAKHEDMTVLCTWTVRYNPCSFWVVAPYIWNMLLSHLKDTFVGREQMGGYVV